MDRKELSKYQIGAVQKKKEKKKEVPNWMWVSINIEFVGSVSGFRSQSKNLRESDIFPKMGMIPILNKFVGHLFSILN